MKVYVLTAGEYSDYRIIGVFSTLEKLNEYKAAVPHPLIDYSMYNKPEEYEVDSFCGDVVMYQKGFKKYVVEMKRDGNGGACEALNPTDPIEHYMFLGNFDRKRRLLGRVWATSKQHALKIMNERRSQLIATGEWDKMPTR